MSTDLIALLSRQSVLKHYDAFADVDWEGADNAIDPSDPRWELVNDDFLGTTRWYRALPQPQRARLGLHVIVTAMKTGAEFESVLKRGLLEFAATLPVQAPELRYVYHEVIEEAQHALMFHELVRRSGLSAPGVPAALRPIARRVIRLGRTFPELFFVFVLGGEDPIDHVQRWALQSGRDIHPLLRRIMQIHVTEEARHVAFARDLLRRRVPALSPQRRAALAALAPVILGVMAQMMLRPPAHLIHEYAIPPAVIDEAYTRNPRHRRRTLDALAEMRALLSEVGAVGPLSRPIWRAFGIWEAA